MSASIIKSGHWGARLKLLQESKALKSQREFARQLGVGPQTLSNWLNKDTGHPPGLLLVKLRETFPDVNVDWLLTGQGSMFVPVAPVPSERSSEELIIEIECDSKLDRLEINREDLKQRMRAVYQRHRRLFGGKKEQYARIPLSFGCHAVVSLFDPILSCHLVYRRPDEDDHQGRSWENLLSKHIRVLNRRASLLYATPALNMGLSNAEQFGWYKRDLKNLIDEVGVHIDTYKQEERIKSSYNAMKLEWERADAQVTTEESTVQLVEPEGIVLVESVLIMLHILIMKELPPDSVLRGFEA